MSTAAQENSSFHKFNVQDFQQWKFQINCALKERCLFQIANGTNIIPKDNADDVVNTEKWEKDNTIAVFLNTSVMKINQITLEVAFHQIN